MHLARIVTEIISVNLRYIFSPGHSPRHNGKGLWPLASPIIGGSEY